MSFRCLNRVIASCAWMAMSVGAVTGCGGRGLGKITGALHRPSPGEMARGAFSYDPDARRSSVTTLSNASFGGEEPYLRTYRLLVDDPDPTVRAAAVKALGQHGTVADSTLLTQRLARDDGAFVRWEAAKALQRIHAPAASAPLVDALRKDADADVRMASALALGQYAEPAVFNALVGAMDDRDFGVVRAAHRSLRLLTGEDLGVDGAAWLRWSAQNGNTLFRKQQAYTWRPYSEPKGFWDKAQFWSQEDTSPRPARGATHPPGRAG